MQKKKRVFIVHGWGGSPEEGWFPWLKSQLEDLGVEVHVPAMPNSAEPSIQSWVTFLQEQVVELDEDTYFVGHSIGCQTILRYLEKLPNSQRAGGIILVAPWLVLDNFDSKEEEQIAKPWIETEIHKPNVFKHIGENGLTAIFSSNDRYVPEENQELFQRGFGANIIVEDQKGHFSGDDSITELQVVLDELCKRMKLESVTSGATGEFEDYKT